MPPVISSDKFTIATTQYPSEERPVIPELQLKLKLQILTLSELIQFRGDRLPTDLNGLRELASLYTNHLGTLCTRYRHGFLKYQNVLELIANESFHTQYFVLSFLFILFI